VRTEQYISLIGEALSDLYKASKELEDEIKPTVPLPRRKVFVIGQYYWPVLDKNGVHWHVIAKKASFEDVYYTGKEAGIAFYDGTNESVAQSIIHSCHYQPRKILRALRRIQAATDWCLRRAEGRRRAAQEILRQQAQAVQTLEAEAVLRSLGK
jgi:hypothetical protein